MSRSYKHHPFAAICVGGSAHYDKTLAARGVRRAHRQSLHIALHIQEFDVVLPHRLQCTHNNTYSWCRDGSQRWCGLTARDWDRYIQATTPGSINAWGSSWYGDENYSVWPPTWYTTMMRK